MRACLGLISAGLALAIAVSVCAAQPISDRLPPEMGGLPANTPARPKSLYQYPAVHDMPPPRSTQPMTEEEQDRLEKELQAARDRQESLTGTKPVDPGKPAAPGSTVVVAPPTGARGAAPVAREKAKTVVVAPQIGARAATPAAHEKASTIAVIPPVGARVSTAAPKKKAATVDVVPPPGVRAAAPPPKKKPSSVIVVPPAGVTANP